MKTDQTADAQADLSALGAHVMLLIFSCEKNSRKCGYDIKLRDRFQPEKKKVIFFSFYSDLNVASAIFQLYHDGVWM